ncbi:hypothetical protein [Plantactinospora sp. CA-290183]|uniref:hypothetical protein n=1 Tax=Plantactinospora sp. CA-290183 TaxID=3240006 RepID=UPI003D8B4927
MLSPAQRDAILLCLHALDTYASSQQWPGPVLFGWIQEKPVPTDPDPAALTVKIVPIVLDPDLWWGHPDGAIGALRLITEEAHHPLQQAYLAAIAGHTDEKILAYLFMYPQQISHEDVGTVVARFIDVVDTDDICRTIKRLPNAPNALLATVDDPGGHEVLTLLRRLTHLTRPETPPSS